MYRLTVRTSIPNTNGTICEFLQSQLWSVPYPWPSSYFPEFSFWLVPDFRSSENLEIFSNLKNRLIIDIPCIRVECAISSKRRLLNPHLYSHPTSGIQSEITLLSYSLPRIHHVIHSHYYTGLQISSKWNPCRL